jgi:hypothetical protein
MPDEKPIIDPESIADYVRIARIVYGIIDQHGLGEIDNPPTVVETLEGAKVRAWLPVAALSSDDEIELDERRAVKTTPSGVVARVWLPVSDAVVRRRRRQDKRAPERNRRTRPNETAAGVNRRPPKSCHAKCGDSQRRRPPPPR